MGKEIRTALRYIRYYSVKTLARLQFMPLKSGKANVGYNVRELTKANKSKPKGKKRSKKQIIAIAMEKARENG